MSQVIPVPLISSEQKLLVNVVHAYDTFSAIPHYQDLFHRLSSESLQTYHDVNEKFQAMLHLCYKSMHLFISSSPDFRVLTSAEQISLYQRNLHSLATLYAIFDLRDVLVLNNVNCLKVFSAIYGESMILPIRAINNQSDFDSTFVKIMFIIFAFSSNCFIVDAHRTIEPDSLLFGTHRLLGSQNVYVELMWNYLHDRYGHTDSIHRFVQLISLFVKVIEHSTTAYQMNHSYHVMANDIMKQIKHILSIDQYEVTPLWGKLEE